MSPRPLVIWIVAILLGLAWWSLRGDRPEPAGSQVLLLQDRLPVERIDEIEIAFRDGTRTLIRRTGDQWRQLQPFPVGIDAFSARQLITTAAALRGLRALEAPGQSDLGTEDLGLAVPNATITWRWDAGSTTLDLGDRTLAGGAWASLKGTGEVWLVDAALHERLFDLDHRLWRDRALLPEAGIETRGIGLRAGEERLILERTPRGWTMKAPVETRADPVAIEEWLARLSRTRALGYLYDQPSELGRYGLEPPIATIELVGRLDEDRAVLRLGDPLGVGSTDRYGLLEGSPTVLRLGEDVQGILVPSTASLVDPTGTAAIREDVARLEIRRPGDSPDFTLERDLDGWKLVLEDGTSRGVDRGAVERLLGQLTEARATEIAFGPYPAELERAVVVLHGFDGRPLDTVRVIREGGEGRWALENGDAVLRIHPAGFAPLLELDRLPPS